MKNLVAPNFSKGKIILLTSSASKLAGGLFATMTALSKTLYNRSVNIALVCHEDCELEHDKMQYATVPIHCYHKSYIPLLNTLGYSLDIHRVIEKQTPQIIHQQGIWMYHSYAALRYKKKYPCTIKIIEPHGMLDPWAVRNSAWKKKIVGRLFEYENLRTADCIHALCQSEYESIRKFGLKNPVAIIPNGIDIPTKPVYNREKGKKTLLFIGRIHPKKGLKEMLLGMALMKEKGSDFFNTWNVHIAGWSQIGHEEELRKIVLEHQLDNVEFIGSVYDNTKEDELCNANAFILPSFSEGLPMSVLEAWAYRLPVLMTDYCNIPEGFAANAAIRIKPTPESIADELEKLCGMNNEEQERMGNNGYMLVKEKFSWNHIAQQTIRLYDYLLHGGEKPEFVYE